MGSSGAEITIETTAGERYQIQCRSSLVTDEWIDYGAPFDATETITVKGIDTAPTQCYFRVVEVAPTEPAEPTDTPPPPPPPPN